MEIVTANVHFDSVLKHAIITVVGLLSEKGKGQANYMEPEHIDLVGEAF